MVHVTNHERGHERRHERRHENPSGDMSFAHLYRPPQRLWAAEPGLGVRSHEPNTCNDRIRASSGVETLEALTCSSNIVASTMEPVGGGIVDGEWRPCALHALETWPKAGLAPRVNLVLNTRLTIIYM